MDLIKILGFIFFVTGACCMDSDGIGISIAAILVLTGLAMMCAVSRKEKQSEKSIRKSGFRYYTFGGNHVWITLVLHRGVGRSIRQRLSVHRTDRE